MKVTKFSSKISKTLTISPAFMIFIPPVTHFMLCFSLFPFFSISPRSSPTTSPSFFDTGIIRLLSVGQPYFDIKLLSRELCCHVVNEMLYFVFCKGECISRLYVVLPIVKGLISLAFSLLLPELLEFVL